MIAGLFLRYIKTYRGINYIPLTDEANFCGLVGDNGIGKSSILEALDAFFNDKALAFNVAVKRSGVTETKPFILPIFMVKKKDLGGDLESLAKKLSFLAENITEQDVNPAHRSHIKKFITHRELLTRNLDMRDSYLIPVGIDHAGNTTLSIFNCRKLVEIHFGEAAEASATTLSETETAAFTPLLQEIKSTIDYIYIPKEIDSEAFTKLEAAEIQVLMGETLNEILESRVTGKLVQDINRSLNEFIDALSAELVDYSYRTPTDRQQNLKKQDVYNLIVQAFFNIRKLHRRQGDGWLEINALSSGEKQKAIIDVAHGLIKNHRSSGENLILAIDEPESSLHMSACFDQFDAIYDISKSCRQLLFSTHWYGFFPTIESGSASIITRKDNEHFIDLINLSGHREQVKQLASGSRGVLPYDIRLKSINDFVQSIITSAMGDNPFSWIICEGSSEKVYLSAYFSESIANRRLRIVPVGGAKEIKRLYQHLLVSYEDFKDEITGKIILISDTDPELILYDTKTYSNLICKRIVNDPRIKDAKLVSITSNPVSPKTEIEDVLNGPLFFQVLKEFIGDFEYLGFLNISGVAEDENSYFALDLRTSERQAIERFFDSGNNKFAFSERYVAALTASHKTPLWISEICGWLE
jgi:predicted ATPase